MHAASCGSERSTARGQSLEARRLQQEDVAKAAAQEVKQHMKQLMAYTKTPRDNQLSSPYTCRARYSCSRSGRMAQKARSSRIVGPAGTLQPLSLRCSHFDLPTGGAAEGGAARESARAGKCR